MSSVVCRRTTDTTDTPLSLAGAPRTHTGRKISLGPWDLGTGDFREPKEPTRYVRYV